MKIKAHLLDISKYNQINNYDLLRRYADGIIVRIGYRGYTAGVIKEDAGFREHMQGILNAGIPYGFYFMSQEEFDELLVEGDQEYVGIGTA